MNAIKKLLISLILILLSSHVLYADWFDDLWGIGSAYYWLRSGGSPPGGIEILDPNIYYYSSEFEDYTLKSNQYLNVEREIGVEIDTDTFSNLGFIRVSSDVEDGYGIYGYDFSGNINNSGVIYVGGSNSNLATYGIYFDDYVSDSKIQNSGHILAEINSSNIDDFAQREAYGLSLYSIYTSTLANSGSISARVEINGASYAEAYSYGLEVYGDVSETEINNSGNILSEVNLSNINGDVYGDAYGLYLGNMENSKINNSGSIKASVKINNTDYSDSYAYGVVISGQVSGTEINNSGNTLAEVKLSSINWDAYGEAYGFNLGSFEDSSKLINTGVITASVEINGANYAEAYVYGVKGLGGEGGGYISGSNIENSGNILAEANLSNIDDGGYGEAYGISFYSIANSTLTNSGNIETKIEINETNYAEAYAYGLLFGDVSGTGINNSGNILSEVNLSNINGDVYGDAYGLYLGSMENSTINNSGNINISFNASNTNIQYLEMSGICINNSVTNSIINNSGTINISISLDNSTAQNFKISGLSISNGDLTVNNSGLIRLDVSKVGETNENLGEGQRLASAVLFNGTNAIFSNTGRIYSSGNARALSLYNNSMVTLQNGFGYVFHGDPDTVKRPIYIDGTSTLNLNSVPLYVYGVFSGSDQTVLGKPYYLIERSDGGTVDGTWGELKSMITNPDITVNWYGTDRGLDSAVIFNFSPRVEPTLVGNIASMAGLFSAQTQLTNFIFDHNIFSILFGEEQLTNKPIMLASAGISDVFNIRNPRGLYKNGIYLLPYFTVVNDSGLGADMNSKGLLLGFEKKFNPTIIGLYAGYGRNDVDFTGIYKRNNEDQDVYTFGLYGIYNADKWFSNILGSYNSIRHKYSGWTGLNLNMRETDKYNSNAFIVQGLGGLKFEDQDRGIYPSIGLRWTYWQTESHTTDVSEISWRRRFSSIDENWLQILAGIDASKKWNFQKQSVFTLRAGLKLESTLNNNKVSVAQSLQGQRAFMKKSIGDTSLIANLSATYSKNNFRIKLGLMGEHNSDYNAYSGYIQTGIVW